MEKPNSQNTKLCPTCGTRAPESAPRCLVCGTAFEAKEDKGSKRGAKNGGTPASQEIRGSRMPAVTLSVPVILLLFIVFLGVGGGLTYVALNAVGSIAEPTVTPTETLTPSPTMTPTPVTPTATATMQPTATPLTYFVQEGDTCGGIAFAFDVSVQSIILLNNLAANCPLFVNLELKIPQPTPTPTPIATNTPSNVEATRLACETRTHIVQEDETLGLIAEINGVPVAALMEWNGKTVDTAFVGETLVIPLCMRDFVPLVGTVTPSPAPPYPAPELLLPRNGEAFDLSHDTVTLQWASVGELRDNEWYQVTVIDLTGGENAQLVDVVKDTKFIVPSSFRPTDSAPHAFRWFVVPVAQIGVKENGLPIYTSGGPVSESQIFIWSGQAPEATPAP